MEKILIVGGAGYVGSVAAENFLRQGYKVKVFDNLIYKNGNSVLSHINNENYEYVYGDLTVEYDINKLIESVDHVILLAGLVGDPITKIYSDLSLSINELAIEKFIDNMNGKGVKKLIFVSTCSNYGMIKSEDLADEGYELNPVSLYAKSKVRIEKFIENNKKGFDFSPTILRFATAFGLSQRMRFDLTISEFTLDVAAGRELLIFDENTWRPYCHVKDFALLMEIVIKASDKLTKGEIFNAGSDQNNYTKKMIAELLMKYFPEAIIKYRNHGSDPRNYRVNFSKARDVLNFYPKHSVEDGIIELKNAIDSKIFDINSLEKINYGNYKIEQ